MPTFMLSLTWSDVGIKDLPSTPNRRAATRARAAALGITVKYIYLTLSDADIVYILEAADDKSVAKLALLLNASGNVHCRIARAYPEAEYDGLLQDISGLPPFN
jgi:uncharacterized protein with GYD domain